MTHYERLGVEQTAGNDDIKRAYFRLVRRFTPERDPEAFMQIRKAYETLSDDQSRSQYDIILLRYERMPEEAVEIMMEVDRMYSIGLKKDAVSHLERSIKSFPESTPTQLTLKSNLCSLYIDIGKTGKAVTIAEELVRTDPTSAEYLQLAASACMARGWPNKANAYLDDLLLINPESEDAIIGLIGEKNFGIFALGKIVKSIERNGSIAPIMSINIFARTLISGAMGLYFSEFEQMNLFSDMDGEGLPWDNLEFAASNLVEHTKGIDESKAETLAELFDLGLLSSIYFADRFDILPHINQVIENIGAQHIYEYSIYSVLALGHSALEAVKAGIPKTLVALSLSRSFSKEGALSDSDKRTYLNEAIALEIDVLADYATYKDDIRRYRTEFASLYQHSAEFMDAIQKYNEQRTHDEINRRISKIERLHERIGYSWLGDDDDDDDYDIDIEDLDDDSFDELIDDMLRQMSQYRNEPIRVVKVGRNEPCPCGSGLKYKNCCGK